MMTTSAPAKGGAGRLKKGGARLETDMAGNIIMRWYGGVQQSTPLPSSGDRGSFLGERCLLPGDEVYLDYQVQEDDQLVAAFGFSALHDNPVTASLVPASPLKSPGSSGPASVTNRTPLRHRTRAGRVELAHTAAVEGKERPKHESREEIRVGGGAADAPLSNPAPSIKPAADVSLDRLRLLSKHISRGGGGGDASGAGGLGIVGQ